MSSVLRSVRERKKAIVLDTGAKRDLLPQPRDRSGGHRPRRPTSYCPSIRPRLSSVDHTEGR